jgi:hypothetical protein
LEEGSDDSVSQWRREGALKEHNKESEDGKNGLEMIREEGGEEGGEEIGRDLLHSLIKKG